MRGLVALDWQRVRARPARLLMPVLTFLTPALRWPLAGLNQAAEARVAARLLVPMLALLTPALRLPLAGLDLVAEARVRARLERHRAGGGSAILVTHQPLDLAFDLQRVLAIGSA